MGYLSDVSLVMTKTLFAEMLNKIPEASKKIIECSDSFLSHNGAILLTWNGIKWYSDSFPISSIHDFLNHVDEFAVDENDNHLWKYHFLRIGEDRKDFEEEGTYWDNPWNTAIVRSIKVDSCGEKVDLSVFL